MGGRENNARVIIVFEERFTPIVSRLSRELSEGDSSLIIPPAWIDVSAVFHVDRKPAFPIHSRPKGLVLEVLGKI